MKKLLKFINMFNRKKYEQYFLERSWPKEIFVERVDICTLIKVTTSTILRFLFYYASPILIVLVSIVSAIITVILGWYNDVPYSGELWGWIDEAVKHQTYIPETVFAILTFLGTFVLMLIAFVIIVLSTCFVVSFVFKYLKRWKNNIVVYSSRSKKPKVEKKEPSIFKKMYISVKEKTCFYVNVREDVTEEKTDDEK